MVRYLHARSNKQELVANILSLEYFRVGERLVQGELHKQELVANIISLEYFRVGERLVQGEPP